MKKITVYTAQDMIDELREIGKQVIAFGDVESLKKMLREIGGADCRSIGTIPENKLPEMLVHWRAHLRNLKADSLDYQI